MTIQTRRLLFGIGAVVAGVLALSVYYASRILADVETAGLTAPNSFDAREARRKINALNSALTNNQQGFVRLTEAEINSFLARNHEMIGPMPAGWEKPKPLPAGKMGVGRCRVDLHDNLATVYTWVLYPLAGRNLTIVWTRTGEIQKSGSRWTFDVQSMQVGHVEIPPRYHERVSEILGPSDETLAGELKLISEMPTVELKNHEMNKKPELRLYSYNETNVVAKLAHH